MSAAAGIVAIVAIIAVVAATGGADPASPSGSGSGAASGTPGKAGPLPSFGPYQGPVHSQLAQTFAVARHLPGITVGGVRAGSLQQGRAQGANWAIATFLPSASAGQQAAVGLQDGAGTGVFRRTGKTWQLVQTGPYGCGAGLPAALQQRWHIPDPPNCSATASAQRAAAQHDAAQLTAFQQSPGQHSPAQLQHGAAQLTAFQRTQPAATSGTGLGQAPAAGSGTGLGQAIARTALGQVGVSSTPAVQSFSGVDCDPYSTLVAGSSANSNGCGYDQGLQVQNENENWCADFNKWVWQRAGVTAAVSTLNAGAASFYGWALGQHQSPAPDKGTPQVGDSVAFYPPGKITANSPADHVGIVTARNADGSVNMVNGDFLGKSNISVQYNKNLNLTTWASKTWGKGEQWVIVAPPSGTQQPAPAATITGPQTAAAGTAGTFTAASTDLGVSGSRYSWTFGDGQSTNATGQNVTHVFSEDGRYTVTLTATSSSGAASTRTWNVTVLGASSAVAAVPSDKVWFATTPVNKYFFRRSASGLAADTWDGASWLQDTVPGQPAADSSVTALSYPDPAASDAMTPHAYFRTAGGGLAQTYLDGTAWHTQSLPGSPAAGTAIVATTTPGGGPAVFYANAAGHLAETSRQGSGWTTRTLPGAAVRPTSLALADTAGGPRIFAVSPADTVTVTTPDGGSTDLPAQAAAGSSLAAVSTPSGQPRAFFTDSRGRLAEATQVAGGPWTVAELPGAPASALAADNYLLPNGQAAPLGEEVFFLTGSRQPEVAYQAGQGQPGQGLPGQGQPGQGWQTASLPGTATGLLGASAYPVASQPAQVFLSAPAGGLVADTSASGAPTGSWATDSLPGTAAKFADRVLLYAATPADHTSALQAAKAAGLASSQVTQSFNAAWDDTLSGSYLVISVGMPATDAIFDNSCGWSNPSDYPSGSTPFAAVTAPKDQLIGAGSFMFGPAATAAQDQQRATGLAYYAVHAVLPPGMKSLPAAGHPKHKCAGSPS